MRIKNILVALAIWLCLMLGMVWLTTQAAAAPAAIVYVDASGADGPGCGAVGNPCATIEYAIENIAVANDTIHVAAGVYVENITIDKNLTLQGAGAGNTIVDGNATDRVITVTNDAMVTLAGMIIQNGHASIGAGIHNDGSGTVYVYNNTATGNGGGIHNDDENETLIINHSTISGNKSNGGGGGIMNYGPLTVTNSTISDNTAGSDGGGIYTEVESDMVTIVVSNSVINGNTTTSDGGGIQNDSGGTVNINNSTISGNTAAGNGGGVGNVNDGGRLNINHSTINDNTASAGGGIYNDSDSGIVNVKNTIIAGNSNDNCDGFYTDVITSQGYNIEDADTCELDQPGDIVNSATVLPFLGPLQNNGGDTQTHALLKGSSAIDAGDPAFAPPPEFDQRGFFRVVGGGLAIGAYEYVLPVGGHTEPVSALALLWPWTALAVAVVAGAIGFVLIASAKPQKSGR